jgi:parallel beta-helix repeat protein
MSRAGRLGAVLLIALTIAACSREEFPGVAIVRMTENTFNPPITRVPVGSPVLFRNMGRLPHNALSVDGDWGTDQASGHIEVPVGQWVEVRFDRPGVYHYYCSFHGTKTAGMVGVVVVGDVAYQADSAKGRLAAVAEPTGTVRHVPAEYQTIQGAVDAATPGDLVLIALGTYREEVTVTTPSLTIRGVDRNGVILEGEFQRGNGIAVFADAVAVENLTVHGYTLNGVIWSGVTGYRGSWLTALSNGDYGIFAYDSRDGMIEHSYANGSPDSGFYIGACQPCRAVVRDVLAERNALGYSGTNSGGDLYIVESVWRDNLGPGMAPNTFDVEPYPPQRGTTIAGNLITGNTGDGIAIVGGNENLIVRNRIERNGGVGVLLVGQSDRNYYPSTRNRILDNVVLASGGGDFATSGVGQLGNCYQGNRYRTARPEMLVAWQPCRGPRFPVLGAPVGYFRTAEMMRAIQHPSGDPRGGDWWQHEPAPPPQPAMPGGAGAPVVIPIHPFEAARPDLKRISLPGPVTR